MKRLSSEATFFMANFNNMMKDAVYENSDVKSDVEPLKGRWWSWTSPCVCRRYLLSRPPFQTTQCGWVVPIGYPHIHTDRKRDRHMTTQTWRDRRQMNRQTNWSVLYRFCNEMTWLYWLYVLIRGRVVDWGPWYIEGIGHPWGGAYQDA